MPPHLRSPYHVDVNVFLTISVLLFGVPCRCTFISVIQGTLYIQTVPHGVKDVKIQIFAAILDVVYTQLLDVHTP